MKRNVNKLWMVMLIIALMASLAACSGSKKADPAPTEKPKATETAKPTATPEVKKDPITIRVGVLDVPSEIAGAKAVAEVFKETHPYVTVEVEPIVGDYGAKMLAQAAAGELADVTWTADVFVKNFVENGIFEPLNSYLEANEVDLSDIYPAMLELGKVDDNIYMLPREYSHIVLFVNTTLLKQEGLSMPQNGWDIDTFLDYATKLTKKDASGKTTQFGSDLLTWWLPVWAAFADGYGGSYIDIPGKKTTFASDPKVVQGLRVAFDMIKDGINIDYNVQYPENMFFAGKTGFMAHVISAAPGVNDAAKAKGFEWDVVTFPKMPVKHLVGNGTSGYGVYAKSKHKEEAGAFVSLFAKQAGQTAMAKTGLTVPPLKSMAQDEVWRSNPAPGKNMDAFILYPEADFLPLSDKAIPVVVSSDINAGITNAMNNYVLNKMSLEDALKEVDAKVAADWK